MLLFVANRGEIARRIIRSAKRFGFKTAVSYPGIDRDLPFVHEADKSKELNVNSPRSAYLDMDLVISTAKDLGATHLHPGYGFLSENPEFVDRVEKSGMEFVGPSSDSMRAIGDKIGSRRFLKDLNIPLLASYDGEDQDSLRLRAEAEKIGFPLLIKPSAGGGGKGMLKVERLEDFDQALESSRRIAKASFGDDRVFLEPYIENARHIEVQILGDKYGNAVAIGERECSIQRKHQKLIEECPCIYFPQNIREMIYEHSVNIAKKLSYRSLGTVEWLWDGKDKIYFLEVNARLQVEHPVTELVYGIDLVEWQLRVAQGESIENIRLETKGHAIEARLCAEDPQKDFMPSGGKIHRLRLPEEARCDFGYYEKNFISSDFDSLIGKIITYGEDRLQALEKLKKALESCVVFGPATNRAFLIQLLSEPDFKDGKLSTHFVDEHPYRFDFAKAIALLKDSPQTDFEVSSDEEDVDLYSPWGCARVLEDRSFFWEEYEGFRYYHADFADWKEKIQSRNKSSGSSSDEAHLHETLIRSPMPGKVIELRTSSGEIVEKGEVILILEAMKMEHKIVAPRKAKIKKLNLEKNQQVLPEDLLVELEFL